MYAKKHRSPLAGLTQIEVAKKVGLSQAQIARLENSSQIPRVDTLIKVAIALGMQVQLSETDEHAIAGNQVVHV
ncbi:helix-turn-helix domain-containing protein [Paenibacillus oryzisoli]|uniref:helix-turn-helix domain-containing protein n=1 Tax=Paenibacillus oryzisoli TaxID=1850517 RepID=UPI0009EF1783